MKKLNCYNYVNLGIYGVVLIIEMMQFIIELY